MATKSSNSTVRLKQEDWDALFPGVDYSIGTTTFKLVPLSLKGIAIITSKLSKMATTFSVLNLTLDDVDSRNIEGLTELVSALVSEAPEILSVMSGLHTEDVQGLPLAVAVELFSKCLDVNIESQDSLVKNFKSLGDKFSKFLGQETPEPLATVETPKTRARISAN